MAPSPGQLRQMGLEQGDLSIEHWNASMTTIGAEYPGLSYSVPSVEGNSIYYNTTNDLWADVGYGPNGANFDQQGIETQNVFVPGYFGDQKPVLGHPPVMTLDRFRKRYLRGLEKFTNQYGADLQEDFDYYLDVAVGEIEAKLGLFLYPRVLITNALQRGFRPGIDFDIEIKPQDFISESWFNWGYNSLQYGPIMSIRSMQLVYPTGNSVLKFPNSWLQPQPLSRQMRLVPPSGALSNVILGPGGQYITLLGGMMQDIPAIIYNDYVAGIWPFPQQLIHAIGMQTAIHFLEVFSDMASQGMREYDTNGGGVTTRKVFSRSDKALAFQPRIDQYTNSINQVLYDWQSAYFSQGDFFVL